MNYPYDFDGASVRNPYGSSQTVEAARQIRALYVALVRSGFKPETALDLTKTIIRPTGEPTK